MTDPERIALQDEHTLERGAQAPEARRSRRLSPLKLGLLGAAAAGAYVFMRSLPDMRRYLRMRQM